jgi:hypothetical protein
MQSLETLEAFEEQQEISEPEPQKEISENEL